MLKSELDVWRDNIGEEVFRQAQAEPAARLGRFSSALQTWFALAPHKEWIKQSGCVGGRACQWPNAIKVRRQRNHILNRDAARSEEHTSELQSLAYLVCRLLL